MTRVPALALALLGAAVLTACSRAQSAPQPFAQLAVQPVTVTAPRAPGPNEVAMLDLTLDIPPGQSAVIRRAGTGETLGVLTPFGTRGPANYSLVVPADGRPLQVEAVVQPTGGGAAVSAVASPLPVTGAKLRLTPGR